MTKTLNSHYRRHDQPGAIVPSHEGTWLRFCFWFISLLLAVVMVADLVVVANTVSALWSGGADGVRQWVIHLSSNGSSLSSDVGEWGADAREAWTTFAGFILALVVLTAGCIIADYRIVRAIRARA